MFTLLILLRTITHERLAKEIAEANGFKLDPPDTDFALFGKESAFSRPHVDPMGTCTHVFLHSGAKIWCVATRGNEELGKPTCTIDNLKTWATIGWDAAFLEKGDSM
jgi:hypothetical protein